ncbi:MAG: hypothetical protein C5B51_13460 [Terriglobia bacterium]|nr:MAG: hypothetical protein C5B51_13460 [Terriglobia bacterium]
MISIGKQIRELEHFAPRVEALRKAFLGVAAALPQTALPANPALSGQCKANIERLTGPLDEDAPVKAIDEASKVALQQIDEICRSNESALKERDTTLQEVVVALAGVVGNFKISGERHKTNLSTVAESFDTLAGVEDITELRRRLRNDVARLRQSVEEMRRENDELVQRFESQVTGFEHRLQSARKDSGIDHLTGLGNRREAERQLSEIPKETGPVCVLLFDIEGFRDINQRQGTMFGDKLLRALAHLLSGTFSGEDVPFRWGSDEFLVIARASLRTCDERGRQICARLASGGGYYSMSGGSKEPLRAKVALGVVQYRPGETVEELQRRAQAALDQNRKATR